MVRTENVFIFIVIVCLNLTTAVKAATLADLVADYTESGAVADTTPAIFPGSVSGTWTISSDDDEDPLNGGLAPLLYRASIGLEGGNGYAGTGTVFNDCCGPFPIISDDGLFDGIPTTPAGTLAIHPGGAQGSHTPPEYLVIQYTATVAMTGVFVNFSFDTPGGSGDGIDWWILDNTGTILASSGVGIFAGSVLAGNLAVDESIYTIMGNGTTDNPGTDQTFLSYEISSVSPLQLAQDPDPTDTSTNIDVNTTLSWTAGSTAISHDVHFGTNQTAVAEATTASPEFQGNVTTTTYDPGSLDVDTTYFWRIDEVESTNPSVVHTGEVWSFTTRSPIDITRLFPDFNDDCRVDILDVRFLASELLEAVSPANLVGVVDGGLDWVALDDYAALVANFNGTCIAINDLLLEIVDRQRLAVFPDPVYVQLQASSYERRSVTPGNADWFANKDWSHYIRQEVNQGRNEWVMMEDFGPGCITRIWIGGDIDHHGNMRFYVDGGSEPVWTGIPYQIVGENTSVGFPLSSLTAVGAPSNPLYLDGGAKPGANLYMPLPYNTSMKVTYDVAPNNVNTSRGIWYNINYRKYPVGTNLESFSNTSATEYSAELVQVNSQLPSPSAAPLSQKQQFNLSDNIASGTFAEQVISGAGAICRLTLDLGAGNMSAALQEIQLQIWFDDELMVTSVPVGLFFGTGKRLNEVEDWYRTVDDQTSQMNAYWVMPYQQSAKVRLTNTGSQSVNATLEIESGSFDWGPNTMYFHANHRQQIVPTTARVGQDWNYVTIQGQGVFVGDTLMVSKDIAGWWGEGDEKIWVDGESFPSHFGTGTEDYYGYAWGHRETFLQPFIGQPQAGANYLDRGGTTVNTRVRALDAIPFNRSLQVDMEIWNWHGGNVDYSVAVFWYGKPGATLAP